MSLCGGIVPLIALLAKPHRGIRTEAVTGVALLMASYGLLAVFIYADFLLVPSLVLPQAEAQSALLRLVQGNRAALATGFLAVAWIGTAQRMAADLPASRGRGDDRLCAAICHLRGIFDGTLRVGTFFDLAWIAPFLCYAWSPGPHPLPPGTPRAWTPPARCCRRSGRPCRCC